MTWMIGPALVLGGLRTYYYIGFVMGFAALTPWVIGRSRGDGWREVLD
jgi:hypothetical protein